MVDDNSPSDLTICVSNLRIRQEVDPNTQAGINRQFLKRKMNQISF